MGNQNGGGSGGGGSGHIMRDSQVAGGQSRRSVDRWLSENLGGYRYVQETRKEPTVYGTHVEPFLHAVEHAGRGVAYGNTNEIARAKDELNAIGKGLHKVDKKYQNEAKKEAAEK